MITTVERIYAPCSGIVEKVFAGQNSHVYEWERLALIRTPSGEVKEVSIGVSGMIQFIHVQAGQEVDSQTVLAVIQDDLLITGSD